MPRLKYTSVDFFIGVGACAQENHFTDLGCQRRDTGEAVHNVKRVHQVVTLFFHHEICRIVGQKFRISSTTSAASIPGSFFWFRQEIIKDVGINIKPNRLGDFVLPSTTILHSVVVSC